ncbi:thiol:disulfide interchange protein DsbA/DsbL [Aerolutibacter ruishenii]|uniref:Thiol:disulfide interchange protein DsbA n=1 Tax=Aerolutibacter ruishenii TaxID=686800 RepID=A0A562LGW0_9GAMM|nr:thiol:disulfide interchange protein DsbA/DsbL [Lysobacter ruishenii]TWI06835.1 thiol:disulfide interchange protein DsbA [Lysobacter ruishenii]
MTPHRPSLLTTLALSALLAITLPLASAVAATPAAKAPTALVAGVDYELIEGGAAYQPVTGKVEVAEVFGYTCPHCAHFEPAFAAWKARQPKDVSVALVAAPFGGSWMPYARAFYAAQRLGVAGQTHTAMFRALHEDGSLPLGNATADEIATFYAGRGVDRTRFIDLFNSAEVGADMQRARDFIMRSGVDGTPTLVVNGKYRVIGGQNFADRLRIVDRLIAQERAAGRPTARAKR